MPQHTPEPWHDFEGTVQSETNWTVCDANTKINNARNNARRIVACVNACIGVDTETLEDDSWRIRDLLEGFDGCVADAVNKKCSWVYVESEYSYETSCGHKWVFVDGDRHDNEANYCMYCGGLILDADRPDFGG